MPSAPSLPWIALTRAPGPELAACELTHVPRRPIDGARAREEHAAYCALLAELGGEVRALARLPEHPDAAFVEDCAVVLDEVAVIPRLGAPSRRGESASVAAALGGLRELVFLEEPTTLDGGDVLVLDDVLLVGQSARTNQAALKRLAHALLPFGYRVKAADVRGALHLKTACTRIGPERLLAHRACVDLHRVQGFEIVDVPSAEPFGANVLAVADTLVVPASCPRTAELLARLGHAVRTVALDELQKAEAGPTCLSLIVTRPGAQGVIRP